MDIKYIQTSYKEYDVIVNGENVATVERENTKRWICTDGNEVTQARTREKAVMEFLSLLNASGPTEIVEPMEILPSAVKPEIIEFEHDYEVIDVKPLTRFERQKQKHEQSRQSLDNADIIELWLNSGGKADKTKRAYSNDIDKLLAYFHDRHIGDISVDEFQRFVETLESTDYSTYTINRIVSGVKSLISFAFKSGYIPFDNMSGIKAPKIKDDLNQRILSREQILKMIFSAEKKPRDYAILKTFYLTGLRVSELANLSYGDMKLNEDKTSVLTVFGKGSKTRHLQLDSDLTKLLLSLNECHDKEQPIFMSQKNSRMDVSSIFRVVQKYGKMNGIKVSPHFLRHGCASHSIENGANVAEVQNVLGHSSLSVTTKYVHLTGARSLSEFLKF